MAKLYDDEMVEGCDTGTSSRVFTGVLTLNSDVWDILHEYHTSDCSPLVSGYLHPPGQH